MSQWMNGEDIQHWIYYSLHAYMHDFTLRNFTFFFTQHMLFMR